MITTFLEDTETDQSIEEFFNDVEPDPEATIVSSDIEKNELSAEDYPFTLSLRRTDFGEDKDLKRFVKSCETGIRRSPEYKIWAEYIRDVMGKYICAISGEINAETTVEIHHHPMSLYDIVSSVIYRKIDSNKEFCSFDICQEVIEIHYQNKIGFIPLVSSLHEKVHNGALDIPMELVSGDYKKWLAEYGTFLDDDDLKRIHCKLNVKKDTCGWKGYKWSRDKYPSDEE